MRVGEGNQADDSSPVDWASDRTRLFPGEVPETVFQEDADHWVRVYLDLVSFTSTALDAVTPALISAAAQDGQGHPDLVLLRENLDRLRGRLHLWEARLTELAAR